MTTEDQNKNEVQLKKVTFYSTVELISLVDKYIKEHTSPKPTKAEVYRTAVFEFIQKRFLV